MITSRRGLLSASIFVAPLCTANDSSSDDVSVLLRSIAITDPSWRKASERREWCEF
jgi:hypothetical protein